MAILTIEISDSLNERLNQEVAAGNAKDHSTLVQALLEAAIDARWRQDVEKKIDEALDEYERGEFTVWHKGDCAKMGREYLKEKRDRETQR